MNALTKKSNSIRQIIYREQVVIDGVAYDLKTRDYSESIAEMIKDDAFPADAGNHYIVDYVSEDIKEC